jgi:hypothetical protein
MKGIFIVACVLTQVYADSSCELPTGMKLMRECCNIPNHSNPMLQNMCATKCLEKSRELQNECAVECYVNMTSLIKDGTINKASAIRIYENNAFYNPDWYKTVHEGVRKCNYDSSGSLEHNLLKFYNCVDDFLSENCVSIMQTKECEPTEEFYENCKNIQPNCTEWPRNLNGPEPCCKMPNLLSNELTSKCNVECQRKELFFQRQTECKYNCTYLESGLLLDGKVNFVVVKKMLTDNAINGELWEKSIENAVETCEKSVTGERKIIFWKFTEFKFLYFLIIQERTNSS